MSNAPVLETERLHLCPMTMEHWPDYFDFMTSDRSAGMGGPFDAKMSWALFCHDTAQWSLMGHGALMITDKQSGMCFGQVGINHGPLFPEHELGWLVYPQAEGKGLAFEAARRMATWARDERQLPSLVSYVDQDNIRSRKLAERLGGVLDPRAARPEPEDLVYRHY
ncbi:N-acetyltransferase [Roseibium denhamense]|uniref:Protein N-acetyltransferase, RimJ/RimL family n=1 Tax=Roseibium denhamense TaxID=76305 RepID=A0ABY1PIX4_9HYPH|nr:GNAT family N-acetyltransferase [Roseibium denhamense]MTI05522.1 N-acetyltransferase [Roseibium denhamense]SMP35157.1 Protein N-acetyltransferase, RimJ/RimL family [Roseibium denhamense]